MSSKKILIAEDNAFVRMQIVKFLQDEGFETLECDNGEQALEMLGDDILLAIADIRMEPMGGFDLVKAMRGRNDLTPVIFITGDQNPDLLTESQKWDVSAVLMKPVQRDRLLQTVSRTIRILERVS